MASSIEKNSIMVEEMHSRQGEGDGMAPTSAAKLRYEPPRCHRLGSVQGETRTGLGKAYSNTETGVFGS